MGEYFCLLQILMVNIITSLIHIDDPSCNLTPLSLNGSEECYIPGGEHEEFSIPEGGNKMVVLFTGKLLDILRQNLPSSVSDPDDTLDTHISSGGKKALEWRISNALRFIEDWEWRLSILQRLLPLSERQWRWKEALTVLRAAPSKLLNL